MKKVFKRFGAFLLASIMMLAMCPVGAFADTATPSAADIATITVEDVEAGATVTAYQIVEGEYNANGFIGYKTVDSLSIADPLSPTPDEIQSIAAQISSGAITTLTSHELSYDSTTKDYTVAAEAGYWIILVKGGSASKVYNPMLAGVYYTVSGSDNTMTNDPVSANDSWIIEGSKAYDKSSEVTVTKKIVGGASGIENGDDVAIGDVVNYSISGSIPAYSDAYTQVTYKITDKTSDGLVLLNTNKYPVTVKVNGQAVEASGDTYTLTVAAHEMTVDFASAYALSHTGQAVVVTYSAQLTKDANTNFDANTNTAKITYSNDPTVDSTTGKTPTTDTPEDKTYHYTFELDGKLSATWDDTKVTTELTKTHMVTDETTKEQKSAPLSGATFTLTNKDTNKVYEATSDVNGQLNFKGLDAGTYTLKEKSAPAGYSLNKKEIPVVISATYNANGTLANYSVKVDGKATSSTYTASYTGTDTISNITVSAVDTSIPNTPLSSLPSTGGMGTYLFTIVGIAIMAIAAGLFIVSRKRRRSL